MSLINDFDSMKSRTMLKLVCLLMLMVPGLAAIYHFNRALFLELDDFKLVLLAVVFAAPSFLVLFAPAASIAMLDDKPASTQNTGSEGIGVLGATVLDLLVVNLIGFSWLLFAAVQQSTLRTYIIGCMATSVVFAIAFLCISFVVNRARDPKRQEALPLKP